MNNNESSDGDSLQPFCSSDDADNVQQATSRVDEEQDTRPRPLFSRPPTRAAQPADLFRKSFQRQQAQGSQQPFFNLLNTLNGTKKSSASSSKPRQSDGAARLNVFQQGQTTSVPTSLGLLAQSTTAYSSPMTPSSAPRLSYLNHGDALGEPTTPSVKREHDRAPTPSSASDRGYVDLDEFAVKMLKENKALKAELAQSQTLSHNLSVRIDGLQAENASLAAQKNEGDKHAEALRADLSSVCSELSSASAELSAAKVALDSNQRDLANTNGELNEYRDHNLALNSTNKELERYQSDIRAKLEATQKSLVAFRNDYSGLITSFTDLKKSYDASKGIISGLSAQVAEYRKAANDALTKIESSAKSVDLLIGSSQVKAVLDELKDTLAESYRTNDLLRDKLHLHLGQIVDLNDRVKELEKEKTELLNLLFVQEERQVKNEKISIRMEELAGRLLEREQEVELSKIEAADLKAKLHTSESIKLELEHKAADDAMELKKLSKAQTENGTLRNWLAEKESRLSNEIDQLNECRRTMRNLEVDLAATRTITKEMEKEQAKALVQIQRSQAEASELRNALAQQQGNAEKQTNSTEMLLLEARRDLEAKTTECQGIDAKYKKSREEITERDSMLKQKAVQLEVLEERLEAQAATLRLSKEQCGDLQERLQISEHSFNNTANKLLLENESLQRQVEALRNETDASGAVKRSLEEKEWTVDRTVKELAVLQKHCDTQAKDLQAKSDALVKAQALLTAEYEKYNLLKQELENATKHMGDNARLLNKAVNRATVLEDRLEAQKVTTRMTKDQLEATQERCNRMEREHAVRLESATAKLREEIAIIQEQRSALQAALNQARQDAADQRALLDERLLKQEAASERLLEAEHKRADAAENVAVQAKLVVDLTIKEQKRAYVREKETEKRLESTEQELQQTKVKLNDALVEVQSFMAQRDQIETERSALKEELNIMELQISNFREANQSLVHKGRTLQERYESGDLSDHERNFVQFMVSTTQSIHESELIEKLNEIRRRDSVISSLQDRVKTLESTIARMLRERGTEVRPELKSLVNLSLWMSSSPQDGLNSVDVQIPTVDPMHLNALTAGPITPREDGSFKSRTILDAKHVELNSALLENSQLKQAPTFAKLSEDDSGDEAPLSDLTPLSPTPAQVPNKRGRAPSPAAATSGRPVRRSRGSASTATSRPAAQPIKALKKTKVTYGKQKKQK